MPPGKQIIRSKTNKGKDKDEVIAAMDRKRAGGAAVVFRRDLEARSSKASAFIMYLTIYGILIVIGVSSFVGIRSYQKKREQRQVSSALTRPSASLRQAYEEHELTRDEYAIYLMYLLVRYKELPDKYRAGIPRLTPEEIYAQIDTIWVDLADDTRLKIAKDLTRYEPKLKRTESSPYP